MPRVLTVTAAVALVALAGTGAPAAEGDVVFDATVEASQVRLGEDAVVRLQVTNRSAKAVLVPEFRLARDSVSVAVAWAVDGKTETRATITRIWGSWFDDGGALKLRPAATALRRVGPGETMTGTVAFPAVLVGDLTLTASWGPDGPSRRTSKPLSVEVIPKAQTPKRLLATVETSKGIFVAELDGAAAFNAVSHFWKLARDEYYSGLTFHRVDTPLLVQGGCPRGDGTGGTGFYLPAEGTVAGAPPRTLARGIFGLARSGHPDSASSQFFAVSDPEGRAAKALTDEFTPLGRVVEGQEIVDELARTDADPRTQRPRTPPTIVAVRVSVK